MSHTDSSLMRELES